MKHFRTKGGLWGTFFLILLLGSGIRVFSQTSAKKDSLEGERLFALAQKDTSLDRQVELYHQASRHFRTADVPIRWWACLDNICWNLFQNYRDEETFAWLDTAITKAWWPENKKYSKISASIISNRGYYFKQISDYYSAKKDYETAFRYYRNRGNLDCNIGRTIMKSLANLHTQFGEYEKACLLLEEASALCKNETDPSTLAEIISDLGVVYRFNGDLDSALSMYDKGLKINQKNVNTQGLLLLNKAEIFHLLGKNAEALSLAQQAVSQITKAKEPNGRYLEGAYAVLGAIYEDMGNRTEAMKYFYGAINIGKEMYGDEPRRETGKIYHALGEMAFRDGRYAEAEKYFSDATKTIIPDLKPEILDNPQFVADNVLMSGLQGLGSIAWESYQKTPQPHLLQTAYTRYTQSLRVQETLRESYSYESSSLKLQEESIARYEYALASAFELYNTTGEPAWLDSALSLLEGSKSVVLKESLRKIEAGKAGAISPMLADRRRELESAQREYEKLIYEEKRNGDTANQKAIQRWEKQLSSVNISLDSVQSEIKSRFSSWDQLQNVSSRLNISQLQTWLADRNSNMIQYFWGETWLFVLAVDRNGIRSNKIELKSTNLAQKIECLHLVLGDYEQVKDETLHNTYFEEYTRLSYELYQILLAPVMPENNSSKPQKLIIVPDGFLGYLPFDVLLSAPADGKTGYRSLDYVLNDFIIRYEYSASLSMMRNPPENKSLAMLGGYAPEYGEGDNWLSTTQSLLRMDSIRGFGKLEHNRKEVEVIAGMMEGSTFLGDQATEAAFRESAGNFRILHLSMHGFTNEENPLYSGLVFSINNECREDSDSSGVRSQAPDQGYSEEKTMETNQEDGFLHAYEIFGLNLQAEMAVLSACKTGLGKLIRGEGIMSLARAFRAAGCPNVVMSLWEADDLSTSKIMQTFYANLKTGMHKDEALHQAKLEYIRSTTDSKLVNPLYWSTFVLIGDDEPVVESDYSWLFLSLGGVLIFFLISLGLFLNRRKPREHI